MRVTWFQDTDALYIALRDAEAVETGELDENFYLMLDDKGGIGAITIEDAGGRAKRGVGRAKERAATGTRGCMTNFADMDRAAPWSEPRSSAVRPAAAPA